MRPGGVASRVACAAHMSAPPRALGAALPERTRTLLNGSGSNVNGKPGSFRRAFSAWLRRGPVSMFSRVARYPSR